MRVIDLFSADSRPNQTTVRPLHRWVISGPWGPLAYHCRLDIVRLRLVRVIVLGGPWNGLEMLWYRCYPAEKDVDGRVIVAHVCILYFFTSVCLSVCLALYLCVYVIDAIHLILFVSLLTLNSNSIHPR